MVTRLPPRHTLGASFPLDSFPVVEVVFVVSEIEEAMPRDARKGAGGEKLLWNDSPGAESHLNI